MIFDDIIGNEDVKRALTGMVGSGRIPHALMFYENDGCGAIQFAQASDGLSENRKDDTS